MGHRSRTPCDAVADKQNPVTEIRNTPLRKPVTPPLRKYVTPNGTSVTENRNISDRPTVTENRSITSWPLPLVSLPRIFSSVEPVLSTGIILNCSAYCSNLTPLFFLHTEAD